jgi:acyl carrier protein
MSDVADRVKKIVVEHLGVEAEKVQDNANLSTTSARQPRHRRARAWRSRKEFNVEIPDDAAETIVTVGDAGPLPREERGLRWPGTSGASARSLRALTAREARCGVS